LSSVSVKSRNATRGKKEGNVGRAGSQTGAEQVKKGYGSAYTAVIRRNSVTF